MVLKEKVRQVSGQPPTPVIDTGIKGGSNGAV